MPESDAVHFFLERLPIVSYTGGKRALFLLGEGVVCVVAGRVETIVLLNERVC